jgi:predicted DsbA family dithiol-disulfide isomerase
MTFLLRYYAITQLTDRTPKTELFHAVMKTILEENGGEKQTEFQEAIFDLYYTQGVFPDTQAMTMAAQKLGVGETVVPFLADAARVKQVREQVAREAQEASRRGITGVPFFEFNGEPAFSGAQPSATFVAHLKEHATSTKN